MAEHRVALTTASQPERTWLGWAIWIAVAPLVGVLILAMAIPAMVIWLLEAWFGEPDHSWWNEGVHH